MSVTDQITALTADKTAIEKAITTKGGTLSQNCGFDTFAADIATIPSGSAYDIDDLIDGSLTEIVSDVTTVRSYCFCKVSALKRVTLPNATDIRDHNFSDTGVETLKTPNLITLWEFNNSTKLKEFYAPKFQNFHPGAYHLSGGLFSKLVFPSLLNLAGTRTLSSCRNFNTLVLGLNSVVPLADTGVFYNTPFTSGGGVLFVPHTQVTVEGQTMWLVEAYPNATNWSALNCTFKEIAETIFSGDGSTTTFTLTDNNAHPDDVFYIKIGNDFPEYEYDSTTGVITFVTAPASGTNNIEVYFKGVETV